MSKMKESQSTIPTKNQQKKEKVKGKLMLPIPVIYICYLNFKLKTYFTQMFLFFFTYLPILCNFSMLISISKFYCDILNTFSYPIIFLNMKMLICKIFYIIFFCENELWTKKEFEITSNTIHHFRHYPPLYMEVCF